MSKITDEAFRKMLLKLGRPDVFWTEFVSVDGLLSEGKEKIFPILRFIKAEHPIVAQVFGTNPKNFERAARIIKSLGFDGIDINMGCPNKEIEKQGAGAALIKKPGLAKKIIRAAKKGAGGLPVSVKTRIGYGREQVKDWIAALLEEDLAVLTVHFRTKKEASRPPAHWELAEKIVELRNHISPKTLIFGNGDVKSLAQAQKLAKETGLDGIMAGRGVLANPWFFLGKFPSRLERMNAIMRHAEIFEELNKNNLNKKGLIKNFDCLKKFFKGYTLGLKGAGEMRERLFLAESLPEIRKIIKENDGKILRK